MTVGELRAALAGVDDALPVVMRSEGEGFLVLCELRHAGLELDCDDVPAFLLDGEIEAAEEVDEPPPLRLAEVDS